VPQLHRVRELAQRHPRHAVEVARPTTRGIGRSARDQRLSDVPASYCLMLLGRHREPPGTAE
jgi:hypothetical protein